MRHENFNAWNCILGLAVAVICPHPDATAGRQPLNLGTAGNYAILAKSGISTVPPSAVTGDLGVSPIGATAITAFSLILDSSGAFSTSSQITGKVYAADYAVPTPVNLTTAVSDMQTAYTDAAGLSLPDYTELGTGYIGGMILGPGLYKWSTDVTILSDVTLSGGPNDVWIFQIAGNLSLAGSTSVLLSGGAQAGNIFWQVAGGVGVALGTTSQFEGTILAQAAITLQTGASINGRLLAQTAVTLDANAVTISPVPPTFASIQRAANGAVTLVINNTPQLALTLQTSTDLINWTTLATPTPTVTPYTYTDTTASAATNRFYGAFYP
ncbi:MAG: ice-binding family protein [Verrucomicrobiota bacterium]